MVGGWSPYAGDWLEDAARASIGRITRIMLEAQVGGGLSLWEGGAGVALALECLGKRSDDAALLRASAAAWDDTVLRLRGEAVGPGLYNGFSGVGWVDAFLSNQRGESGGEDSVHEELERVLLAHLELRHARTDVVAYDLISGLVGFGVYALERQGRGKSLHILDTVIDELLARAAEQEARFTSMHLGSSSKGRKYQDPGMAHGIPGVVALLARAAKVGQLPSRGWHTLEDSVRHLLRSQRPTANGLSYAAIPQGVGPTTIGAARVAWCYGDLSVAAALLLAGECCQEPKWSQEARRLATNCANVPFCDSGVVDHGLCHGAAGVAHTLARMAASLRDEHLWLGARKWLGRTLGMRMDGIGIDGYARMRARYPHAKNPVDRQYYFETDRGFLMGAAGVALALDASLSEEPPSWDRALLLSA